MPKLAEAMTKFFRMPTKICENIPHHIPEGVSEELYRRVGVVVKASASHLVDRDSIFLFESYQKNLKNGIYSFPAWCSVFKGCCGEQAGKFAFCVLGQGT